MRARRHPLEKKVRRLRGRLRNVETLRLLLRCLLPAAALLALLVLIDHVFDVGLDIWAVAGVLGGVAAVVGLVWAALRRPTLLEAAASADARLQLRERLSSALCALDSEKRMDRALVEDAEERARSVRSGDVFPYPFYRELKWLIVCLGAAALMEAFMPRMLLFARAAKDETAAAKPIAVEQAQRAAKQLTELKTKLDERTTVKDPLNLDKIGRDLADLQKEFEAQKLDRTAALAKISKLTDQVKEHQKELADKSKSLENLKAPDNARFTQDLAKALEAGNLKAAQQKLDELKKQMEGGKMSEADKQKMAEELKKVGDQLKDMPGLAMSLKKAGDSLKQGQMAEAASSCDACKSDLADLADALKEMETLDQMEAALANSKDSLSGSGQGEGKGLGEGQGGGQGEGTGQAEGRGKPTGDPSRMWTAGDSSKEGSGMGEAGKGAGGVAQVAPDQVNFKPDKLKGQTQAGEIIASFRVSGEQIPGEAKVKYQETYTEYRQACEDTLHREAMPLEYRSLVTDYFDAIRPEKQTATAASQPSQ
ncbi:MAG: hypothetical protein NTW86_20685 [Candidatus Sumerlaeota bacterium]|nr:hypothetical protein [Candidatus Sumerlaeota bacterium]